MLGVCFQDVERVEVLELDDPEISSPDDAIVEVRLSGLCGSDLHPFFGRERGLEAGTVMGHEFVGEVVETGSEVTRLRVGDRVCSPFSTNCGDCYYCQGGLTSRCQRGQLFGWRERKAKSDQSEGIDDVFGLHGGQAQYVRVPLADATLMPIAESISDETSLLLGDNLSTARFAVDLAAAADRQIIAVIGCGTVGLLTIALAQSLFDLQIVAIDPNPTRGTIAERLGARALTDVTTAQEQLDEWSEGRGADAVIELVGLPDAQQLAHRWVRPGGILATIGCHCAPNFAFTPAQAYDKNLTYRTGRCPARSYMPKLAEWLVSHPLDLSWCITHRFPIAEAEQAYQVFARAQQGCVKAVLDI